MQPFNTRLNSLIDKFQIFQKYNLNYILNMH